MSARLTPEDLLRAYASGVFPMAKSAGARSLFWVDPEERGILPLDDFHVPRRLARTVRQGVFSVRINERFAEVMTRCAEAAPDRPSTWINRQIRELYGALHQMGNAHSVEAYLGDELAGGLYGVTLGAAFFGESMFSRARDASKIALVHLVAHLKRKGFRLLDTQFITEHLAQFGAIEIPRADYLRRLGGCLDSVCRWPEFGVGPKSICGVEALQSISQTS